MFGVGGMTPLFMAAIAMLGCLQCCKSRGKNDVPQYMATTASISGVFANYFSLGVINIIEVASAS